MKNLGYYGKTIHRGDFVRFNLPKTFVNVWDDWLQELLLFGEEKHGSNWSTCYADADSYRFVLSPGIAGDSAWAGIVSPSIDKVARRFPFCLSAELPGGVTPILAFSQLDGWFTKLEHLSRDLATSDYEFDNLQQSLTIIDSDTSACRFSMLQQESVSNAQPEGPRDESVRVRATTANALNSHMGTAGILDAVLRCTLYQYSAWSTASTGSDSSSTYVCDGLPFGESGIALFDRKWNDCASITIDTKSIARQKIVNTLQSDIEVAVPAGSETPGNSDIHQPRSTEICDLEQEADRQTCLELTAANTGDVIAESSPENALNNVTGDEVLSDSKKVKSIEESEGLSTGDWSELETPVEDEYPVPVPVIEPLELEEESSSPPPWEQQ
ncbi:MAG: type VI secretion system-associated protein TagF [Granulosicoccus sp.]